MDEIPLLVWSQVCDRLLPEGEMDIDKHAGLLTNGGIVVIIGGRESNAPEFWNNPRCLFLDGETAVKRGLPSNTKAVVFTRWVGHTAFKHVLAQTRTRDLPTFPIQGTGALKRTLAKLLEPVPSPDTIIPPPNSTTLPEFSPDAPAPSEPAPPAPPETTVVAEETMTPKRTYQRGDVSAWVRDRYVPGVKVADILQEAEKEKVPFKAGSISAAYYAVKRGVLPRQPAAKKIPPVAAVPAPATSDNELVRLVDDALASLQLVREAALKMSADRVKMAEIIKLAQQIQ